ncbi:MAG: spore maturation protein A [Oscillospiraceae bacterium]|nr:spore maturation protein A [Oscillospiraceae bacterium]
MMSWLFGGMIIISVLFASVSGHISELSNSVLNESSKAIQLVLTISGTICLWSGLMKIADRSGLTAAVSRMLSPITMLLFKNMDKNSPAAKAISMNLTANLLGLGNAATPLGIAAMREMEKELHDPYTASDNMVTFTVLNTASLQLVPTTTAMLRLNAGAAAPLDILPCVLVSSLVSVLSGILCSRFLAGMGRKD